MLSRRQFISSLAMLGGSSAALAAMDVLGVAPAVTPIQDVLPPALPAQTGAGRHVAIVGAGIAGLVAALELRKLGFRVSLLEARQRVGGRVWTLRPGVAVEMDGSPGQRVSFDEGLYFNVGAGRIPTTHQVLLHYCRQLGVELEVMVNSSRSARYVADDAQARGFAGAVPIRRLQNDARGHIAELLVKSTRQGLLDAEMTADDRDGLIKFLRYYGDLASDGSYRGSSRAGFTTPPGAAAQVGQVADPLDLHVFLDWRVWWPMLYDESIEYQPSMLQPVGGMDKITEAFARRLDGCIELGAELVKIEHRGPQPSLVYRDSASGSLRKSSADYVIITTPLPVLANIANDFDAPFQAAIRAAEYMAASKVAWQAPRFWESDAQIYGGISFVDADPGMVWYPSNGFHRPSGILVGAYNSGHKASRFGDLSLAQQFASSRLAVESLHPGRSDLLTHPVAFSWHKSAPSRGGWAHWRDPQDPAYVLLNQPQRRVYLAGEHLSQLTGWQEGAALSALRVTNLILQDVRQAT